MARHTNIYNCLLSFFTESIDAQSKQLMEAFAKRFFDADNLEMAKSSFNENCLAIVDLAKDQAIHFSKKSELLPEWEMEQLVEEVIGHIEDQIREMKKKGVFGKSAKIKIEGAHSRWEQLVDVDDET